MSQVAQPHEVTLLVGAGILLTFTAGVLNISTFLGPEKKLISHMSGTTVKMGAFFGEGDAKNGCENLAIMACFFAGALLAGFLTSKPEWKSLYTCALAMAAVGVLQVVVAALTDNEQAVAGFYIGAFACGLQNAMLTTITGFMRTTHVTGTVTDIGLLVGQGYPSKKGDHAHWWKTKVLAIDLVSYALGGVAGRGLFDVGLKYKVGYVPGGITLAVSAAALYHCFNELTKANEVAKMEHDEKKALAQAEAGAANGEDSDGDRPTKKKGASFRRLSMKDLGAMSSAISALEQVSKTMAGNINSMPDPPERIVAKAIVVNEAAKLFKSKSQSLSRREKHEKDTLTALNALCKHLLTKHPEVIAEITGDVGRLVDEFVKANCVIQVADGELELPNTVTEKV
ncbi:DUF1275 domain-containing protein [Pseudoscourfieldia marina]